MFTRLGQLRIADCGLPSAPTITIESEYYTQRRSAASGRNQRILSGKHYFTNMLYRRVRRDLEAAVVANRTPQACFRLCMNNSVVFVFSVTLW